MDWGGIWDFLKGTAGGVKDFVEDNPIAIGATTGILMDQLGRPKLDNLPTYQEYERGTAPAYKEYQVASQLDPSFSSMLDESYSSALSDVDRRGKEGARSAVGALAARGGYGMGAASSAKNSARALTASDRQAVLSSKARDRLNLIQAMNSLKQSEHRAKFDADSSEFNAGEDVKRGEHYNSFQAARQNVLDKFGADTNTFNSRNELFGDIFGALQTSKDNREYNQTLEKIFEKMNKGGNDDPSKLLRDFLGGGGSGGIWDLLGLGGGNGDTGIGGGGLGGLPGLLFGQGGAGFNLGNILTGSGGAGMGLLGSIGGLAGLAGAGFPLWAISQMPDGKGAFHNLSPEEFAAAEYKRFLQESNPETIRAGADRMESDAANIESSLARGSENGAVGGAFSPQPPGRNLVAESESAANAKLGYAPPGSTPQDGAIDYGEQYGDYAKKLKGDAESMREAAEMAARRRFDAEAMGGRELSGTEFANFMNIVTSQGLGTDQINMLHQYGDMTGVGGI